MYHLPRLLPPPAALATAQELAGLATAQELAALATAQELAGLATAQELAVPAAPATAQELAGRGRAGYTEYVAEWNGKASNPTICDWATKLKGHNHLNLLTASRRLLRLAAGRGHRLHATVDVVQQWPRCRPFLTPKIQTVIVEHNIAGIKSCDEYIDLRNASPEAEKIFTANLQ